jgi:hypothetical protein
MYKNITIHTNSIRRNTHGRIEATANVLIMYFYLYISTNVYFSYNKAYGVDAGCVGEALEAFVLLTAMTTPDYV